MPQDFLESNFLKNCATEKALQREFPEANVSVGGRFFEIQNNNEELVSINFDKCKVLEPKDSSETLVDILYNNHFTYKPTQVLFSFDI